MLYKILFYIEKIWSKTMPLRRCQKDGKMGWAWGHSACQTGPHAKEKAHKIGIAIELKKQARNEPSEFDKASLPSEAMIECAKVGLDLRDTHKKGGENLVVLTLARQIAAGEFISSEDKAKLKKEFSKRSRFATAGKDTLGYINYMLIGGSGTEAFLND